MKQVTVSKSDLIETVTKNRLAHTELYQEATEGYWKALEDELLTLLEAAKGAPNVRQHTQGKNIVKEIVVPGKLVNLVVK